MTQPVRKFEVIPGGAVVPDGGSLVPAKSGTNDRTNDPLTTPDFEGWLVPAKSGTNQPTNQHLTNIDLWLETGALAELAGVSLQAIQRALKSRHWRGADLVVREVEAGRGRGGRVLQVHVDSLPADLRELWYLQRGITLHEKPDATTGGTVMVPVDDRAHDARFDRDLSVARWRHDVIRPALKHPAQSNERRAVVLELAAQPRLTPNGKTKALTTATLYNWLRDFEAGGLNGLLRKRRDDRGELRICVTRTWDRFFADHVDDAARDRVGNEITHYIRSLWASGERGWRAVSEKATTRLIEVSRGLGVVAFDTRPIGTIGARAGSTSQFAICAMNRRRVEKERQYAIIAVQNKDNAKFQDTIMPSIRRDYSDLLPRDVVVGDVHPIDIMMTRPDGTTVYPKGIAWYDVATNEIHFTIVLLEPGEGIRREHVAQSFCAMVEEWGLPKILYLDNGSEYQWDAMIGGFTQLSKLTSGAVSVFDLGDAPDVAGRVAQTRESVIRSRAYNAKGKPGIEGSFSVLEQAFFARIDGWVAGDRMKKKTHAKGKDPLAFPGGAVEFLDTIAIELDHYHKRPQHGRLAGRSPNECLRGFIDRGWGKTVLSSDDVLALAFSEVVERVPDRGRVSYTPPRGQTIYYYDDALLGIGHKITLRVPAFNPDFVFCFNGETMICQARVEQTYGVLDRAGAVEGNRRAKALRRQITEKRRHVALLSLVDETARHVQHMPDAPDAPVAATVDAGMLDRMAQIAATPDPAPSAPAKPARQLSQWGHAPENTFKFEEDDEDE